MAACLSKLFDLTLPSLVHAYSIPILPHFVEFLPCSCFYCYSDSCHHGWVVIPILILILHIFAPLWYLFSTGILFLGSLSNFLLSLYYCWVSVSCVTYFLYYCWVMMHFVALSPILFAFVGYVTPVIPYVPYAHLHFSLYSLSCPGMP